MLRYIIRRILLMVPTLLAISFVAFMIIQLPPGSYLDSYITQQSSQGITVDPAELEALRAQYGLDRPIWVQYLTWMQGVVQGDFGYSFHFRRPVGELIWERLGLSVLISVLALVLVWSTAIPLGIIAAVKQRKWPDYLIAIFGFIGLATADFLLALILLYIAFAAFGVSLGGLFSPEYLDAAWSLAKVGDLAQHLWIPIVILATNGVAGLSRIMRANLLDELRKPYVTTARAKGLPEARLIVRYPVRIAVNPIVSHIGGILPGLVSGETIIAIVLTLPTTGPLLLTALESQDMYLAATIIMMLSILTVIGVLLSDLALVWFDPRIRYDS